MTSPATSGTGCRGRPRSRRPAGLARWPQAARRPPARPGRPGRPGQPDGRRGRPARRWAAADGRRRQRAAHRAVTVRTASAGPLTLAADPVAVPVQVQAEPGAGAEVGQRDRLAAAATSRPRLAHQPGLAASAAMPSASCAQRATSFIWYRRPAHSAAMSSSRSEQNARTAAPKPPSKPGWAAPGPGREVGRQRRRPVPADQEGDGRAGQQRRQPVGRQRGQAAEQLLVPRRWPAAAPRSAATTAGRPAATSPRPPPAPGRGSRRPHRWSH